MKTDRLLLVAIVAVMAAVVGYLFFSDDARPTNRGDAAALTEASAPRSTLGAYEEQKRLEKAREGCVEVPLPADFRGRSAEDVAAYFGVPSQAYRISTANSAADGYAAGKKVYAPAEWIEAQRAELAKETDGPGGRKLPEVGSDAAPGSEEIIADSGAKSVAEGTPQGSQPKSGGPKPSDPSPPVVAQKPTPRADDPSEKEQPWAFLMQKNVKGGDVPARGTPREAAPAVLSDRITRPPVEASATLASKPTAGRTYRAVSGDTLWKIAEVAYGKGSRYREIAAANAAQVGADGSLLRAGMVIRIP